MPKYELIYFNLKARAELARMCFAQGGVEYEDTRIEMDQWPELKPKMKFGQLPVLKVDGVEIAESGAINRYVAKVTGLAGKNDIEAAQIDMWYCAIDDVFQQMEPLLRAAFQNKEDDMKKLLPDINEKHIQPLLKKVAECRKSSGWLASDNVSYADFAFYNFCTVWVKFLGEAAMKTVFETHGEELKKYGTKVKELPKIKEWFEKRPDTKM